MYQHTVNCGHATGAGAAARRPARPGPVAERRMAGRQFNRFARKSAVSASQHSSAPGPANSRFIRTNRNRKDTGFLPPRSMRQANSLQTKPMAMGFPSPRSGQVDLHHGFLNETTINGQSSQTANWTGTVLRTGEDRASGDVLDERQSEARQGPNSNRTGDEYDP